MDSILRKVRSVGLFLRSRAFAVGALSMVLAFLIYQVTEVTHAVYIRDGENVTVTYTMQDNVLHVLEDQGISVASNDRVHFSGFGQSVAQVEIQRSFPVKLTVNGHTETREIVGQTVRELLDSLGIELDGNDKINMDMESTLFEDAHLILERIDYTTRTEEKTIPFDTELTHTSLLPVGKRKVLAYGEEGQEITTYSQKLENGQVIYEEIVEKQVIAKPVTQEVLIGAQTAVSPLDFGYKFDEDGAPIGYKDVMLNQRATGYSARAGAKTASGRYAVPGHVAVNSNRIPYGTKLYIASPDNSFIYGYAIAADTGTGLMAGDVDIDLFYDSYTESVLNGMRNVNIYILS